jgi:hypothetical protein
MEFRADPVGTFKKYNQNQGIILHQYVRAAGYFEELIRWFDEDWAKAQPESTQDEFGRSLATKEDQIVALAAFAERFGDLLLRMYVLPNFKMGHLANSRAIAEHIVKNDMYWQFLQFTKSTWKGDFATATKSLLIPWETGKFSKWTYDTLSSYLKQWEPDELRQLVREAGWRLGEIGDDRLSKLLTFNIMEYANGRDLLTHALLAAMRVREKP